MTEIFVSYKREEREDARRLAEALEQEGWRVWWDPQLVAGDKFDAVIEEQLQAARSVVVLWSERSVASDYVRDEATFALDKGKLVPVLLERDVEPPFRFRGLHTIELSAWDGDRQHPGYRELRSALVKRLGSETAARPAAVGTAPGRARAADRRPSSLTIWAALALVLALVVAFSIYVAGSAGPPTASDGEETTAKPDPDSTTASDVGDEIDAEHFATFDRVDVASPMGIDDPTDLAIGTVHRIDLEKGERAYFRLEPNAGSYKVTLDARQTGKSHQQARLSILDEHGGTLVERAIDFNQIDVGLRGTYDFSLPEARARMLKLGNDAKSAAFWVSVVEAGQRSTPPFFGDARPVAMAPDEIASGTLQQYQSEFYTADLGKGRYVLIADLRSAAGKKTNLLGYVAFLDADGGGQEPQIRFNDIGVETRKTSEFTVSEARRVVIRVASHNDTVDYALRVTRAAP